MPLNELLRQILSRRGFLSAEALRAFLEPKLSDIPHPDGQMLDLDLALNRLEKARALQEEILVFGDYDVDGTTSAVLLTTAFRDLGFRVNTFIPHRVKEGYGVTEKSAQSVAERFPKTKVVVTCDCGIGSHAGIESLNARGIDVIVTDHHEVPSLRVAALAVLNPKQKDCPYPAKNLAGVGVAFLLVMALRRRLQANDYKLTPFLELVALGTVCDIAELKGINRVFVKIGLQKMKSSAWPALRLLFDHQNLRDKITARDLGFVVGPRLNASGRIGEPDLGFRFLMARSETEALPLLLECETKNRERREMQDHQVENAIKQGELALRENPSRRSLVIVDSSFHLGIVGLVASKLSQNYQRPTCVLTELTDEHARADLQETLKTKSVFKGSLRAPRGYHLAQALSSLQERFPGLLLSAGGHALAAGLSLEPEKVEVFQKEFENVFKNLHVEAIDEDIDAELKAEDFLGSPRDPLLTVEFLDQLEPFGAGNPKPKFLLKGLRVDSVRIMKGIHLKLKARLGSRPCEILQFKSPWVKVLGEVSSSEVVLDLLVEPLENSFQGITKVEFELKDLLSLKINGKDVHSETRTHALSASANP